MTITSVAWPTEATVRNHAELDHSFAPDHIEHTTPTLLLYEHRRAHSHTSAIGHKTPHRHHTAVAALAELVTAELHALSDGELADRLDRANFEEAGAYIQTLAAEVAARLRAADRWQVEFVRAARPVRGRVWSRRNFETEAEARRAAEQAIGAPMGDSVTDIVTARIVRIATVAVIGEEARPMT